MSEQNTPATPGQHGSASPAILCLEDGTEFTGVAMGALGVSLGEVVFATGMSGYQETMTDPSYAGQILVHTSPHIGNTGFNTEDNESSQIWVSGYVVRELSRRPSNWRSETTLAQQLNEQGIVGICGVDTRAITRHLRDQGSMKGGIFSGAELSTPEARLARVQEQAGMLGASFSEQVSTAQAYTYEPADHGYTGEVRGSIAAVDLGIKTMTGRHFASRGIRFHILPATASFEEIQELNVDGVFFSNGPGDPSTATEAIGLLQEVLRAKIPFFGICFGNQLLGRALGFDTYKLPFGHRGINQPVLDVSTGKVEITSQNHGFALDMKAGEDLMAPHAEFGRARVSHLSLNDQVVEGIQCLDIPAFSVQYHPEAAAGPHDSAYLFDRFIDLMLATTKGAV